MTLVWLSLWSSFALAGDVVHQVRLTDAFGTPLSGSHDVQLQIVDDTVPGDDAVCHTAGAPDTVFTDGYASVWIDDMPGNCPTPAYLAISVGDPLVELAPRHRIAHVPDALRALSVPAGPAPAPGCGQAGLLRYDTDNSRLLACDGTNWDIIGGGLGGSADNPATSCDELLTANPSLLNGVFWIGPAGQSSLAVQAYCEFDDADGPITWALFEQGAPPLHYWDMQTLSGTDIVDRAGTNNMQPDVGTAAGAAGVVGSAYSFTSSAGRIYSVADFDASLAGASAKSVSAWAWYTSAAGDGDNVKPIISFGSFAGAEAGCGLASTFGVILDSGDAYFVGCSADVDSNVTVPTGSWHHVAATYDGTTVRVFLDGAEVASGAKTLDTRGDFRRFVIGADAWWAMGNHWYTEGRIDEVRVFGRTLSAAEVDALYDLGVAHGL